MILLLAACAAPAPPSPPASEAPLAGAPPASPAAPAPAPIAAFQPGEARDLPGGTPRVGLAARPGVHEEVLTVQHPDAEVVLEAEPSAWASLPPGTPALGYSAAGTTELRFRGLARIVAGCDGGSERTWALFDASSRLPEGPVLIGPADGPRGEPVEVEDHTEQERAPAAFVPLGLGLVDRWLVSKQELGFRIRPLGDGPALEEHLRKPRMGEAPLDYEDRLDLDRFVPRPVWAVELTPGAGWMLVEMGTWEGIQYTLYEMGAAPRKLGSTYLYWCAY